MLSHEDLKQIAKVFGLTFNDDDIPESYKFHRIYDGLAKFGDVVWWASDDGPEETIVGIDNLTNIKQFPEIYSFHKPIYSKETLVVYTGDYED